MIPDGSSRKVPRRSPRPGRPPLTSTEDILDAAERIGLDSLSRAAVARELGVSDATIRNYVDSSERLYSLACARVFSKVDLGIGESANWQDYLRLLSGRFTSLAEAHPGIEDYVLRGPYESETLDVFDAIISSLMSLDDRLDRRAAHVLGSRMLTLTAALRPPRINRYPDQTYPNEKGYSEAAAWTIEAFLLGAEALLAQEILPEATPTPEATWTHIGTTDTPLA